MTRPSFSHSADLSASLRRLSASPRASAASSSPGGLFRRVSPSGSPASSLSSRVSLAPSPAWSPLRLRSLELRRLPPACLSPPRAFGTAFLGPCASPSAAAAEARVFPELLSPAPSSPSSISYSSSSSSCPLSSPSSPASGLAAEGRWGGSQRAAAAFVQSLLPAEMLPDARGLVYKIHYGVPLPILAPRLCSEQKVQELAANVAFRLLDALREADAKRKGATWEEERKALRRRAAAGDQVRDLLDCHALRKGDKKRPTAQSPPLEATRIRCYWPDVDNENSKMSVFFRELHAALYLLFEPQLFSSPSLASFASFSSPLAAASAASPPAAAAPAEALASFSREARPRGELLLGLLHPHVMAVVVPSLKESSRLQLLLVFLHSVESYFSLHPCSKQTVDPNLLFLAIGSARFLLLLTRLGFLPEASPACASPSVFPSSSRSTSLSSLSFLAAYASPLPHQLYAQLSAYTVDGVLLDLLQESGGNLFEAVRFATFLRVMAQTESVAEPLKDSRWTLQAVAESVASRKSEHLLLAFLRSLAPESDKTAREDAHAGRNAQARVGEARIRKEEERERGERLALQVCMWLARKTPETGEIADPWGYVASRGFLLRLLKRRASAAPVSSLHAATGGRVEGGFTAETEPLESQEPQHTLRTLRTEAAPGEDSQRLQSQRGEGEDGGDDDDGGDLLALPSPAPRGAADAQPSACIPTSLWALNAVSVSPREGQAPAPLPGAAAASPLSSPTSSAPRRPPPPAHLAEESAHAYPPLELPFGLDRVVFLDSVEGLSHLFAFLRASQEATCRLLAPAELAAAGARARGDTFPVAAGAVSSRADRQPVECADAQRVSGLHTGSLQAAERGSRTAETVESVETLGRHAEGGPAPGGVESRDVADEEASGAQRVQVESSSVSGGCASRVPPLPSVPFLPFVVALDLEWTLPHAASVLSLATETRVFLVDLVNHNPVYRATLLRLLRWLFTNPFIAKLAYQARGDFTRLFFALGSAGGRPGALVHCIDLRQPRVCLAPESERRGCDKLNDAKAPVALDSESGVAPLTDAEAHEEEEILPGQQGSAPKRRYQNLREMCRQVLGVDLDKSEQRSNWNMRPLTASQVLYAAKDAYALILLEAALREQGWAPENILGGLGEFSAINFRGRPSSFQINYQKNASEQASKIEAADRRQFRWQ
ncbi:hypothetical protein BESB_030010 [Besnoitia besnoiti]|uniref:3'-5' exonuclease domain-containing protein n=1 Tax=Besnoitia besnoiti TaxID=94643 RepID=A0A2A9M656_BESBE|nr:hypothetical protein BESB_030010 [Besnoitia besnoiti]PFH31127.1 hypothetical protein BESB_030010 [Besnoitia besnoiti]